MSIALMCEIPMFQPFIYQEDQTLHTLATERSKSNLKSSKSKSDVSSPSTASLRSRFSMRKMRTASSKNLSSTVSRPSVVSLDEEDEYDRDIEKMPSVTHKPSVIADQPGPSQVKSKMSFRKLRSKMSRTNSSIRTDSNASTVSSSDELPKLEKKESSVRKIGRKVTNVVISGFSYPANIYPTYGGADDAYGRAALYGAFFF